MDLGEILKKEPRLTVKGLQELQKKYDKKFVADELEGFDKVRHTYSHMGKLFGRLAEYVQMIEDGHKEFSPEQIKEKVIPDLLVYSIWLAEEFGVNVEEAYLKRVVGNIKRLHQDKISQKELDKLEEYESYLTNRFSKD